MKPKRCVIVCPTDGVIDEWKMNLEKAGLKVVHSDNKDKGGGTKDFSNVDGIILTKYNTLAKNKTLNDVPRDLVVYDEAHWMRGLAENPPSSYGKAGYNLSKSQMANNGKVLYMSATPWEFPQQAKPYVALGLWKSEDGTDKAFNAWAETQGVKVKGGPKPDWKWKKDMPSDFWSLPPEQQQDFIDEWKKKNAAKPYTYSLWSGQKAQKETLITNIQMTGSGQKLARKPPLDIEVHNKFKSHEMDEHMQQQYNDVMGLFATAIKGASPQKKMVIGGQRTFWARKYLESAKVHTAIEVAKQELAAGRKVVIMSAYNNKSDIADFLSTMKEHLQDNGAMSEQHATQFMQKLAEAGSTITGTMDTLKEAFPEALEYHGGVSPKKRALNKDAFNYGAGKILIANQASAGTGVSFHDTIGDAPRSQINITLPWTAMGTDQLSGRTARHGSKTDVNMHWLFAKDDMESKRAAAIATRMKLMGGLVGGIDPEDSDELWNAVYAVQNGQEPDDAVEGMKKKKGKLVKGMLAGVYGPVWQMRAQLAMSRRDVLHVVTLDNAAKKFVSFV